MLTCAICQIQGPPPPYNNGTPLIFITFTCCGEEVKGICASCIPGAITSSLETTVFQELWRPDFVPYPCPNSYCDEMSRALGPDARVRNRITCHECHLAMCFECQAPWHRGKTCAEHKAQGGGDDSEAWLLKNTKKCPGAGCAGGRSRREAGASI
ncbi:hypothetical protein IMZ48_48515 [Candidatus Bathyarchaeota archaeon]|nr:hypothetical protein [Candidatus Bathyarchaeota archaeon]